MRSWCCLPSLKQREGVVSISLWLSSVGYNYFLSQFIPVRSCSAPLPLHILLLMGLLAQTTQLRWENNLFADQLHHHSQDLLPLWRITPQILQKCHRPKIYQWLQMGGGLCLQRPQVSYHPRDSSNSSLHLGYNTSHGYSSVGCTHLLPILQLHKAEPLQLRDTLVCLGQARPGFLKKCKQAS